MLSNTFTMAGSVDTFNLAQFKQNYAELLAPAGSTKEGSVTAADISATVSGGSVVVAAEDSVRPRLAELVGHAPIATAVEALEMLGFARVRRGKIFLTNEGYQFAEADILNRKKIFS